MIPHSGLIRLCILRITFRENISPLFFFPNMHFLHPNTATVVQTGKQANAHSPMQTKQWHKMQLVQRNQLVYSKPVNGLVHNDWSVMKCCKHSHWLYFLAQIHRHINPHLMWIYCPTAALYVCIDPARCFIWHRNRISGVFSACLTKVLPKPALPGLSC